MRSFKHWTLRYLFYRSIEKIYRWQHPDLPWLTQTANEILHSYLKPTDTGLEFGSGRSTIWLAKRVSQLTSVEHNPEWHQYVQNMLKQQNITNVDHLFAPRDKANSEAENSDYVRNAERFPNDTLDFVLVDGIYRDFCARASMPKIKPGGVLIIDNVNRHLPSNTRSPYSRTFAQGPENTVWAQVADELKTWRTIWTSSGVGDTAFFFKPIK